MSVGTKERMADGASPVRRGDLVRNMNPSLRGGVAYFLYRNSSKVLGKVKTQAEERLRTHLMNRYKISDRETALLRFPRQTLYANYGLYKVPMTAGWNTAHASV